MKEIPILFKTEMVKAILAGSKTQTRRITGFKEVNADPGDYQFEWADYALKLPFRFTQKSSLNRESLEDCSFNQVALKSPYGMRGDLLWVKETFQIRKDPFTGSENVIYKADNNTADKWRPSLFMPRYASRITLEIVLVRCERLNEITEADAIAEGIEGKYFPNIGVGTRFYKDYFTGEFGLNPTASYRTLWESINGVGSWDLNPFVFVIEFKRIEP